MVGLWTALWFVSQVVLEIALASLIGPKSPNGGEQAKRTGVKFQAKNFSDEGYGGWLAQPS